VTLGFGPPADPVYLRFLDGLRVALTDSMDQKRWRWRGFDQKWCTYSVADWVLEDVGLPDTGTGTAVGSGWSLEGPDAPDLPVLFGMKWHNWEVNELSVPELFRRVARDYQLHAGRWPNAVWSPWGHGDWRNAFQRKPAATPVPAPAPGSIVLNAECQSRVREAREWARLGVITVAQAQNMIEQIVAQCTGVSGH
jgi:hypothetical protein